MRLIHMPELRLVQQRGSSVTADLPFPSACDVTQLTEPTTPVRIDELCLDPQVSVEGGSGNTERLADVLNLHPLVLVHSLCHLNRRFYEFPKYWS